MTNPFYNGTDEVVPNVSETQMREEINIALTEAAERIERDGCDFAAVVLAAPHGEGHDFSVFSAGDSQCWMHVLAYIADVAAPELFQQFLSARAAAMMRRANNQPDLYH